jgi:integrase
LASVLDGSDEMGRRRSQHGKVHKTTTQDKSSARWYFRARTDILTSPGEIEYKEGPRQYLGYVREITKREAENRRDEILATVINKPVAVIASQVRFGAVLDRWLATLDRVKESTAANYESMAAAHLRPQWGDIRLCDITPMAVEDWLHKKARVSTKQSFALLKTRFAQVWRYAIFAGFTRDACPLIGMPRITRFGKEPRAKTIPTIQQLHEILYLLDEPYRSLIYVCALTGLRISEAMALTVAQLCSESTRIVAAVNQIDGRLTDLKAKYSDRWIPMACVRGNITLPLDAKPEDRPFHVPYDGVRCALKEAAKTAGIDYPGFGCHTFRRLHNTEFRRAAGDSDAGVMAAMAQLGHGDRSTNDLYMQDGPEELRRRAQISDIIAAKMSETVN